MSLWRRAPRQVYCVYGQDEYLSEGHPAGETEPPHDEPESDFVGRAPEVGAAAAGARSRGPRLIGVGLLLGATIGAGGLVVSHLNGQSPRRGGAVSASSHRVPQASSGSARRAPGVSGARPDLQARSSERSASPAWTPESSGPGVAAGPRGGSTATPSARARQTVVARGASATADVGADASTDSPSPTAASATAGEEFEFER